MGQNISRSEAGRLMAAVNSSVRALCLSFEASSWVVGLTSSPPDLMGPQGLVLSASPRLDSGAGPSLTSMTVARML